MQKMQNSGKFAVSMVIFGTIGLFVRNIGLPSGEIALYRAILATVFIGGVFLFTGQKLSLGAAKKALGWLLLSGAAMGFNWILLFQAYRYTTVSMATLTYYFAPVLVTLISALLFREKMTAKSWFCFGMATVGVVLMSLQTDGQMGQNPLLGIVFGFGAAGLYATVMLLNKRIQGIPDLHRSFYQFLAAIAVLIPYVLFTDGVTVQNLDFFGWGNLLLVGLFHTGVAYLLYFSAMKTMTGQKIAVLSYLDPLVAVILSVTVLRERLQPLQWIGGILLLGFTLYNELPAKDKKKR